MIEHKKREYSQPPPPSPQNMYHHQSKVYVQPSSSRESPALPPGTHLLNASTTITPTNVSPYKQHGSVPKVSPQAKYNPQSQQFSSKPMSISISPTMGGAAGGIPPHERHPSISPNSILYQQQQAQHQQYQMAEYHHHQQRMQQQQHHHHQQQQQHHQQQDGSAVKCIEFKAPPESMYRDRLPHDPSSRIQPEDYRSDVRQPPYIQVTNQPRDHSRPSSSSSQPDYTQVSPAKMALRRHLSQEKLVQQIPPGPPNAPPPSLPHPQQQQQAHPMSTKTIGDLVNGEIERTLEISNQSIINAAVSSSIINAALAGTVAAPTPASHTVINTNIQRPERVSVRLMEESGGAAGGIQYAAGVQGAATGSSAYSPGVARPNSRDLNKSPISQNNLATLAQVAYTQPKYVGSAAAAAGSSSSSSSREREREREAKLISPRTQYNSSTTVVYQSGRPDGRNGPAYGSRSDERYIPLPRAEMKPYLESYFNEDHKPHHLSAVASQREHVERRVLEDRRNREDEKPLEGMKSRKIKSFKKTDYRPYVTRNLIKALN